MDFQKALLAPAAVVMALGAAFSASASPPANARGGVPMVQVDAEQARQESIDFEMAPIKSEMDLSEHLRTADKHSPLMALSPGARQRFIASLGFNENGLVSYRYDDLARELTASQAYRLLSLFGVQRTTHLLGARTEAAADAAVSERPIVPRLRADHTGYKCVGSHNCYMAEFYICTDGC
jgi:hypothetical protein